jgi:hypothetical protein
MLDSNHVGVIKYQLSCTPFLQHSIAPILLMLADEIADAPL